MNSKDMQFLRQLNKEAIRSIKKWNFKREGKCIVYQRRQKMEEAMYKDTPVICLK
jgi:hypothetical protein